MVNYKIKLTFSIASLALIPRGVLAATAALNMSPVAKWHKQYSFLIIGDWVPFPDPGGPVNHSIFHDYKYATSVPKNAKPKRPPHPQTIHALSLFEK